MKETKEKNTFQLKRYLDDKKDKDSLHQIMGTTVRTDINPFQKKKK